VDIQASTSNIRSNELFLIGRIFIKQERQKWFHGLLNSPEIQKELDEIGRCHFPLDELLENPSLAIKDKIFDSLNRDL